MTLSKIWKALAGALGGAVTMLVKVWPDGVTAEEWGQVAGAAVTAGLIVFFAPKNKTGDGDSVTPPRATAGPLR